ncbi:hypothetical protein ABIB25_002539 [Nakamurella sp. UYEF19]|uniref:hypothetical protein n=1 Tax=Nakamurella sp. UYEF19 TaxID=1756392 RepID=UPI0033934AF5
MFYPDAVTLRHGVSAAAVLDAIDLSEPGASIKDSFADLDLSGHGFRILFEAQWIWREPGQASGDSSQTSGEANWDRVSNAAELAEWAQAWDGDDGNADLFRPDLLGERDVCVLAQRSNGHIVAGAIANRSSSVVGISNVFALEGVSQQTWAGLLRAVDLFASGMPLVGYEHGADLMVALDSGFRAVGPLRIWIHEGP